jgi:hypothetical protein
MHEQKMNEDVSQDTHRRQNENKTPVELNKTPAGLLLRCRLDLIPQAFWIVPGAFCFHPNV